MPIAKIIDNDLRVSNTDFLKGIFNNEWDKAHVTAFPDDPSNIPNERRGICWGGGMAKDKLHRFSRDENQYFTISLFTPDEQGWSRRRKAHFDATFVIVADDVEEKIPFDLAAKLPEPSYKLYTSKNSQQWGWILKNPETDQQKVDNLVDGWIKFGLVPEQVDTGMKNVTRYVRLPEGSNTKSSRLNEEGKPYTCWVSHWEPNRQFTLEELAAPFNIDLNARGYAETEFVDCFSPSDLRELNHPLTQLLTETGVGADGWIRIDCPNAANHSGGDSSGAAYRVTTEGNVHFTCHHGHCMSHNGQKITGPAMVQMLDEQNRAGGAIVAAVNHVSSKIRTQGTQILAAVAFPKTTADGEDQAPANQSANPIFDRYIFVPPLGAYYDVQARTLIKPAHMDLLYKAIFTGGKNDPVFTKRHAEFVAANPDFYSADGIGWHPTGPNPPARSAMIYSDKGQRLINEWQGFDLSPKAGDIEPWLAHIDYLVPDGEEADFFIDYCAALVQRLDVKPNFCILMRGPQGNGKDLVLKPLGRALGHPTAQFAELDQVINNWGDYLSKVKMLVLQEVNAAQNKRVANDLKLLLASNGSGRRNMNMKGSKVHSQLDLCGVFMMTNHENAVAIEANDRRYFVLDMPSKPKDKAYYDWFADDWMDKQNGSAIVLDYLLKRDISQFSSQSPPPKTKAFYDMVAGSRYDYEYSLEESLSARLHPFNAPFITYSMLMNWKRDNNVKGHVKDLIPILNKHGWSEGLKGNAKVNGSVLATETFYVKLDELSDGVNLDTPKGRWEFYNNFRSTLNSVITG